MRNCLLGLIVLCLAAVARAGDDPVAHEEESGEIILVADWSEIESDDVSPVSSGPRLTVASRHFRWHDASRRRTVPVRVFYPAVSRIETLPVIVFSHGLGGSYDRCAYLGTAWASRGFFVVLLQHPGSDENVWKGKVRILNELRESYKFNWSGRTRAADIRFVLDRLQRMHDEGRPNLPDFDPARVGVGGYDLGALAALLTAGQTPPDGGASLQDRRVGAILAMSPPVNRPRGGFQDIYAPIDAPTLFISGTEDDGVVGSTKAYQRRIPFDAMSGNDRYLVIFHGADHHVYGGHFVSLSLRARNDKQFQAAIVRVSSCFWQAHLAGDAAALERLNGYGLRSMLGLAARVERRLIDDENEAATPAARPETETAPPVAEKVEQKTELPFPLTRYYRAIAEKYADPG